MNDQAISNNSSAEQPSSSLPHPVEKLQDLKQQLGVGKSPSVTVRQFLEWFGYARRGRWVVKQIRETLDEHGLHTDPDFEFAYIDAPIVFLKSDNAQFATDARGDGCVVMELGPGQVHIEGGETALEISTGAQMYADPTYRIGKLPFANRAPVSIHPDHELREAWTVMMRHDYSQLPVMTSDRNVRGLLSWKSMAVRLALGAACQQVKDCMTEPPEIVSDDSSLFRVINLVVEHECILVRDKTAKITGIVTASDLSETFHQLGRPFLLLAEIENLIRGLLEGKFSADELQQIRDSRDTDRQVQDVSDLTFGEYVRLIQEPDRWNRLNLKFDRVTFVKDLEKVNGIRNDVMHFDPEGITDEELEELRKTAKFLQEVRAVLKTIPSTAQP